jgi:diguanylate cyclase (GGDEF) domain
MNRPLVPEAERVAGTFDTTRLGMLASIILMSGGLYWTAAVGLLTVSALKAYSVAIVIGAAVLIVVVIGATFWSAGRRRSGSMRLLHSDESTSPSMSTYDTVTGLPTNRLFTSLLNQALQRAPANGGQVAILMVELDHFTLTNELQGQMNRNLIYRVQAARVKSALRTVDCVARLAERTFVVLLDQVLTQDHVVAIAKKIQVTVSLPFVVDGHEIFLTSRIGISLSTREEDEGTALIQSATQAVATARAEGYVIYGFHGAVVAPQADSAPTIAA